MQRLQWIIKQGSAFLATVFSRMIRKRMMKPEIVVPSIIM